MKKLLSAFAVIEATLVVFAASGAAATEGYFADQEKKPAPTEVVLATCAKEDSSKAAFTIVGELEKITGPRISAQSTTVELKDGSGKSLLPGGNTYLVKELAYQLRLYGGENAKVPQEGASVYGYNVDKKTLIVSIAIFKDGDLLSSTRYECALEPKIFEQP